MPISRIHFDVKWRIWSQQLHWLLSCQFAMKTDLASKSVSVTVLANRLLHFSICYQLFPPCWPHLLDQCDKFNYQDKIQTQHTRSSFSGRLGTRPLLWWEQLRDDGRYVVLTALSNDLNSCYSHDVRCNSHIEWQWHLLINTTPHAAFS